MKTSEVNLPILSNSHQEDKLELHNETIDTTAKSQPQDYKSATKTTITNTTYPLPKFRSHYPTPTDLPDIVRDRTWNDPFYNNEMDAPHVIAVFDFDRTKYNHIYWYDRLICLFVFALIFNTLAPAIIIWVLFLYWVLREKISNRATCHVAMTCHCIYFDVVPVSGSSTDLIRRKIIPFHEIQSCTVQWEGFTCTGTKTPKVVLVMNDTVCPWYHFWFVADAQEFVDIVNVMKERSNINVSDDDDINNAAIDEKTQQQQSLLMENTSTRYHTDCSEEDIVVPVATAVPHDLINDHEVDDMTAREIV